MPKLGNILPDMGNKQTPRISEAAALYARANLSDALFTQTQQRVLSDSIAIIERTERVAQEGWVTANPEFIVCEGPLAELPVLGQPAAAAAGLLKAIMAP